MPGSFLLSDLDLFFDLDDFGETAIWWPDKGEPTDVTMLFERTYLGPVTDLRPGEMESPGPAAFCRTSDVPDVAINDLLSIAGTQYVIFGVEPDGTGVTVLHLREYV